MSGATAGVDPRQPERTALAWRRTLLAALGCAVLLAAPAGDPIAVAGAVVLGAAVLVVAQVRSGPLRRGVRDGPRPALLVAVTAAVVVAAACAGVLALRALAEGPAA